MDIDEDVINKFANALRNHHVQRTVSLYSENRSRGNSDTEKYEIKDIISGVAKQLKAIQNADNLKNRPSGKGIPDKVKKSSFLPVHMLPVEQPPKQGQSHKFETQCILDTQLINIIDNAEAIIDAEKGITQEFDTTFCHKDLEQSVDDELINISQKSSTVFKDSGTVDNICDKSKSPDKTDCQLDRDETNLQLHDCSISDDNTVKHIDVEKRMIQEFDTTFSLKDLHKYIEEKNDYHETQESDSNNVREKKMENENIQAGNYRESEYVITDDTFKTKNEKEDLFVSKLSLTKERTIADITCKDFVPTSNTQRINVDVCDNFDTQCKFYFDTCESDSDSQNKELKKYPKSIEEEPKSPILNKIRRKEKSNTPSPLIFELETFEKFEAIALPVIENHDFETAKRVINSQILNRELFIYTHAEAVLSDRDKDIQIRSSILESDKQPEFSYNTCTDNKLHLKEDSMLFSSDEENDVQYNVKELPLTCAIHNSFPDEPYILDKTMYVGFQTASNKSIQISTDSYCKAKSIFNNFENIESENLSGTNIEALNTKVTTSNVDKLDHVNMNDETNNNYDDIAYCFETAIGETFNVFEHKGSISNINENKIKNNAENQSDHVENLPQLHDNNIMSANKRLKLREVKETSKSCADVGFSSTGKTKDNNFDSNFADYLKFDDHILEEFNTDLIPEVTLNKIDELTKGDINDFAGFKTANNKMIKISTQALMKTRNIFEDINSDDNLSRKSGKQSSENLYSLHRRKSETISTAGITPNIYLKSPSKSWSSHTQAPSNSKFMNASNQNNVKNKEDLISADNKEIKLKYVTPCKFEKLLNDDYNKSHTRHICSTKKIDPFAKSKKVFQGTDDEESNTVQDSHISKYIALKSLNTAMCQGFKTAANKPVGISAEALAKSKMIFQTIDDEGRNIVKDSDNLSKEKQLYPIALKSLNTAMCQGFKTAANKPVGISAEALAKSKKIFQNIDDEGRNTVKDSVNSSKEKQPYPIAHTSLNTAMCQGFKTATNKPVKISAEALAKSKMIFQTIDDEERNIVKDSENLSKEKQPYPIAHTSLNTAMCQGFKTATNKPVKISAEALAKSKKIFQTIDDEERNVVKDCDNLSKEKQPYPIAHTSLSTAMCQGFKTATNKPVKISAEALAKSKMIFQTIDDEGRNESENTMKEKQPYPIARTSQNAICQGFKTAGNKPVEISEDALAKSKMIFESMDKDCEIKQIPGEVVEKQPDIVPKRQRNFIGFDTASNKKVKVSENALLQSRHVLRNANLDLKNDNCIFKSPSNLDTHKIKATDKSVCNFAFKTGNNTQINISEEALKKSRNMFSDLDESIQANADPKLNLGDVISEKEILEDFNTEVIKDFENTVYTEDFIKTETPKSKRSGSPILSCPKSKKSKKFETPINIKKFVAPINRQSTIKTDTTNLYSFDENYKKIKNYTLKDLNEIEKIRTIKDVDPYILDFRFETLLDFEFMGDRNDIDNDRWTTDKITAFFTDSVNKRIIPQGWIENHLKMIIWKLVCYEIRFPGVMKNICTVKNVLEQLKYRYKRELYNVERPILRKILEKDEVSSKLMILSVAGLFVDGVSVYSVTNQDQNIELLLTDGWYAIKASIDRMIDRLVCEGKISVGTKLAIHGAELLNCEQGIAPWEDTSSIRLKISGNSTRRAKWDARLGLHGNGAMLSRLLAVKPEGGRVSQLRTLVTRVYPTLYIEKFPDGSTLTRSERLEHIHQMKYETERQIQMEKLYEELERFSDQESQDSDGQCLEDRAMESGSQISRLMKKSRDRDEFRANLTSSQAHLLQQHSLKQKEKLIQALQDKFQELVKKRGLDTPRNVVPLMKIRIADVETGRVTKAMVTIWKPNETLQEILTEGTWIDLYNVVPTSVRYSEIQISAGRQSVFRRSKLNEMDKLKTLTKTLKRQCYTTKDLQNPSMNTDYNEVDTVGLIFMIEPQTMEIETKNQPFQNVYLTDENKNIICVNFWGGIKKFGFQNILDTCQIVACVNLQKRAGNSRKNIPQYRATEFTYFTKTPKNDSIRKLADDLTAKFSSLDKRKFIDDCVALKNNYHNLKCGNTENVSPYRLNTSDYNVYKNKVYIDSPLVNKCTDVNFNLTGLDFESTFKQSDTQDLSPQMLLRKRKVNEKIAKLKMYGEPPPLSPIHLINKSSNAAKAFKSPLTKNDISTSVASPSSLPQNKGENKSSLDCQQNKCKDGESKMEGLPQNGEYKPCVTSANALPQNRVDKVDSSPVLSVNRTYVKRASINPVKLNFDNAIETSITDPFAEDFDGSPPLSLDVDFAS